MSIQISYTKARANLAGLLNNVSNNNEIVIINRKDSENVAMISESELSSLLETAHLLRSPKNAKRLLSALLEVQEQNNLPQSIDDLRREFGLEKESN